MNKTLQVLYDEHAVIVNAIDTARNTGSLIDKDNSFYEKIIRGLIRFFRLYADQYHHHKEEIILFPDMASRNEILGSGVIHEMFQNHEDFREMIRNIELNLDQKKYHDAQKQLNQYTEALLDHIAVENDELFLSAETLFNDKELEQIGFRFSDCDRELGDQKKQELVDFADSLRKELLLGE
ncbi:MAG: hemerythrin domain-containing protein [Bacteroidetes bacterium]|nr:hemerythrin domain-containing protein [Bacteroidota bacterium]